MRRHLALVALLPLLAPSATSADPLVLFNNFGPGDTFGPMARPILGPGYPLSEGDVTPGQWFATAFPVDAPGTFTFTGLDVALSVLHNLGRPATPVEVNLQLVADVGGLPGSTALATMTATAVSSLFDGGAIVSVSSGMSPLLTGGMTYWLIASTNGPEQGAGWMGATTDPRSASAIRRVDGDWDCCGWPNGAIRVFGDGVLAPSPSPVPEPASVLLIAAGLGTALRVRRRMSIQRD